MITTADKKKIYVTPLDHQIEMGGNYNDENIVSGHTRSPNGNKWRVNSNSTGLQNINQIYFSINNKTATEIKEFNQIKRETDGAEKIKFKENLNKENDLRRILVKVSEEDERGGSTNINSKSNYLKVEPDSINSVDSRLYSNNNPLPDEINHFHRFPYFQQHYHHHPQPTYSLNPPYFDSYLSQEGNGNKIQLGYDKFRQSNIQKNNNYKFGIYERHRPPDPMIQVLLSHYGRYLPLNHFNGGLRGYGFYSYSAGNDYHNNLPSGGYKVVEDYD